LAGVEIKIKELTESEMSSKKNKARDPQSGRAIIPHLETPEGEIMTETYAIAAHLLARGG